MQIGIDLGATKIEYVLIDKDSKELISLREAPTDPTKIIKSNLAHFCLKINFGFINEIFLFFFKVFRDELAM